jgi:Protein of unknown function (DUF2530)
MTAVTGTVAQGARTGDQPCYKGRVTRPKPRVEPLDPPMLPFALAGTAAFAVAGLVLLAFHGWLAAHGHTDWLWNCVAGFLVGIPGLIMMARHDAKRRRRRALTHPEFVVHDPVETPED